MFWSGWQFLCGLKNKESVFSEVHPSINCYSIRAGPLPSCLWDHDLHLASMLQCNVMNYNRIKGLIFKSADLATVTILIFKCELLLHSSWLAHGVQK